MHVKDNVSRLYDSVLHYRMRFEVVYLCACVFSACDRAVNRLLASMSVKKLANCR